MEFNSALPIYLQVISMLKREIVTGQRQLGDKLPSVREMAVDFTINPNTVSRVYRELENEEICFTRRGMGTFVTEDAGRIRQLREEMAQELVMQFLVGMKQIGFSAAQAAQFCIEAEPTDQKTRPEDVPQPHIIIEETHSKSE